jgi:hypothetical protein
MISALSGGGENRGVIVMWLISHARARWVVPVAAVGVLAMGGVAFAAIPDSNGVIHGCFKKAGGNLRVVDSASNCDKQSESSIDWNSTGPQGAPGISGYQIVTKEQPESALGFFGSVSVNCPTGKKVLGGGALAVTADGGVQDGYQVLNSSPLTDSGWRATFNIDNPLHDDFVLKVYAICANVTT